MSLAKQAVPKDAWKLFEAGFSSQVGVERYLQKILEHCVDWFGATGASVFLRQKASTRFKLAAQAGSESHIPRNATITEGSGIAGLSIESGKPLLISDPLRHPLLEGRINTHQVSLGSSIVMPLLAPNEGCIGVLNLSRVAGSAAYTQGDVDRVAALANQISLAVSNARLFAGLNEAKLSERAARQKLEGVVQSVGVAILVFDHKGAISELNRAARELVQNPKGDWRACLAAVSPHLVSAVAEAVSQTGSRESRKRIYDKDQDRSWSIVSTPLGNQGATVVVEETTAVDRSQREMSRLARLAEIGQMTAAIAHEIRNPLTGIRSAAQMITSAPEMGDELAQIIEEEVLKLSAICEEFLDFSRPLALRQRELRLEDIARNLVERHRDEFEAKEVSVAIEIVGEQPTIYADVLRLEQVMRNLLLNALQACECGGTVRVILRDGGFSVEDTGKGMQEADLQKLFTPFFTTKAKGTGLGLCNVRKIIDAHGGTISVWSEHAVGTRFDVVFGGEHAA